MRALIKYQTRKHLFVFVLDSLMAEQQPENKSTLEEQKVPPAEEAEEEALPKAGSPVPPVAKANTPELTESPEMEEKIKIVTKEKDLVERQILVERGRRLAAGRVVAITRLRIAGRIAMFETW